MPNSKRHHFVPELLLKRFTDDSGRLFFFDHLRSGAGVRRSTPSQLFCQTHLYSEIINNGAKNSSLEDSFAILEGRVGPLIDRVVTVARQNKLPDFSSLEKEDWDHFFLLQWKRVPDIHTSVPSLQDTENDFDCFIDEWSNRLPNRRPELEALKLPEAKRRLIHNAKVRALGLPALDVRNLLAQRGLAVMRISRPDKSFVIGSFPVVKLTLPGRTHILDPAVEVWLPVAHDVALGLGQQAGTELLVSLSDTSLIRHLNEATVRQSTVFAGRSEDLVRSLGKSGWKQQRVGLLPV